MLQLIIEGQHIAVDHLLLFSIGIILTGSVDRQFFIITSDAGKSLVESRLSLLPFVLRLEVIIALEVSIRIIGIGTHGYRVLTRGILLQCGIIVHLGVHPVDELSQRQLHQLRLQKLLLRDGLRLFERHLLFLNLNLTLFHFRIGYACFNT